MVKDIVNDDINKILEDILRGFIKFDGSIESVIDVIESNRISVDKLKELLASEDLILNKTHLYKMELILAKQHRLFKILEAEKEDLIKNIKQINKKSKVVNNYICSGIKSIFLDKET